MTPNRQHPSHRVGRREFLGSAAGVAMSFAASSTPLEAETRSSEHPSRRTWIPSDDLLRELGTLMRVACLPGLSIAVVENGSVVWNRSLGVLNARTAEPASNRTL